MAAPEKASQVTLRDLARVVGVSHVTVSLALRDNPKIPKARRTEIQAVARRLGYRPNAMAAALAHHKTNSATSPVKAVIAWLNQWSPPNKLRSYIEFDSYWKGAAAAADKFGYRLEEFVCGKALPLARLEKILATRNIRGILLPPHLSGVRWDGLRWEHFSAVRFGRTIPDPRLHIVTSDQVANTMLAFKEIRNRGYDRIGFVSADPEGRRMLFKAGFLMAQSNLARSLRLPVCSLDKMDAANDRRKLGKWLRQVRPDAILTDVAEVRGMLHQLGCRVPDDVGLAALSILDGNADAGIDQHPEEIGRVAILLVISLINDHARGPPPIFRQSLIEGSWVDGSTMPARKKSPADLSRVHVGG